MQRRRPDELGQPAHLGLQTPDGSLRPVLPRQAQQVMERPKHLTWEESACYTLTLATAYRMLFGHRPHAASRPQRAGVGRRRHLGSMAIQLIAVSGANAIGVISEEDKREFVLGLGAKGVINRKTFDCWGQLPDVDGDP
jgi:crotonyl-CoA carboxylase/reductase